jgi:hypothetical protein
MTANMPSVGTAQLSDLRATLARNRATLSATLPPSGVSARATAPSSRRVRKTTPRKHAALRGVWAQGLTGALWLACSDSAHRTTTELEQPPCAASVADSGASVPGDGTFRCTAEGELQARGSGEQAWITIEVCVGPPFCDAVQGICSDAPCDACEARCNDAVREVCEADRTGWLPLETCGSAAQCLPEQCLNAPGCELGATRCDGARVEQCTFSGWATKEMCANAALCAEALVALCTPPSCAAGQTRCNGERREACNADRADWELVEECPSPARCSPDRCL